MSTSLPSAPSQPPTITLPSPILPTSWTLGDLEAHLGDVSPNRIRLFPPPGMATEDDLLQLHRQQGVLCELVNGVLVEKVMGSYESVIALVLVQFLGPYITEHPLGVLLGEAGMLRLQLDKIRIPDVSFIRWERFPNRKVPKDAVWKLAPDLAVEVLSEGNTQREIELKLDDYFASGTQLVWIIDPAQRTAMIYTSRQHATAIDENGSLDGGEVLPGFMLPLKKLFDAVPIEP